MKMNIWIGEWANWLCLVLPLLEGTHPSGGTVNLRVSGQKIICRHERLGNTQGFEAF